MGRGPRIVLVAEDALRVGRVDTSSDQRKIALVSSGVPLSQTAIAIVREDGEACASGEVGEVWVSGAQVEGGQRMTGDFGFTWDGELFLVGRARDRFQLRGANFYHDEIATSLANALPEIRSGRCAVFPSDQVDGSDGVIVFTELRHPLTLEQVDIASMEQAVRGHLSREFGIGGARLYIAKRGTLPTTTSGKLRNEECRHVFASGVGWRE